MISLVVAASAWGLIAATPSFTLKESFTSGKKTVCLSEILTTANLPAREQDKLARYCRIELNQATISLSAKDIELHAWAAGVIPEKISGSRVAITYAAGTPSGEQVKPAAPTSKLRRGSTVRLTFKSENMLISRDAVVLMDVFPGETVDVRLSGTRKNFRAKLITHDSAELVQQ